MIRDDFPQPVEVRKAGDSWQWVCRRAGYDRIVFGEYPTWAEAFARAFDHSTCCNVPIRSIVAANPKDTQ